MSGGRNALLIWSSILVGLQILTAGAALGDLIGTAAAGFAILAVAALQGGTQFYIRGQVTPNGAVAAAETRDADGDRVIVAGPAAAAPTGEPVAVIPVD